MAVDKKLKGEQAQASREIFPQTYNPFSVQQWDGPASLSVCLALAP